MRKFVAAAAGFVLKYYIFIALIFIILQAASYAKRWCPPGTNPGETTALPSTTVPVVLGRKHRQPAPVSVPQARWSETNSARSSSSMIASIGCVELAVNAVPSGTYTVRIVSGDPDFFDSVFRIAAEGVLTVSGTPTASTRWIDATRTVTVTDGRLTITNAAGAAEQQGVLYRNHPAVKRREPPPGAVI
jgi:hypothetical protein